MSKVYILIGAVGAGKSTCAEKLNREQNAQIISADQIYKTLPVKRISTKPYDHKIRRRILQTMCAQLDEFLSLGRDCVVDYTNMPTQRRRQFLSIAKRHNAEICCKFLKVDADRLMQQMIKREAENAVSHKIVDKEYTTKLYLLRVKKSSPSLLEGFDLIETYLNGTLTKTITGRAKKRFIAKR